MTVATTLHAAVAAMLGDVPERSQRQARAQFSVRVWTRWRKSADPCVYHGDSVLRRIGGRARRRELILPAVPVAAIVGVATGTTGRGHRGALAIEPQQHPKGDTDGSPALL